MPAPRTSHQRDAVAAVLRAAPGPLTAEEVLVRAREAVPRVGRRTVFRHLHALIEAGKAVRVVFPGHPPRYERAQSGHHPHLVCHGCARVFDLPGETPDIRPLYAAPPGFLITGEEVIFYGKCPDCASPSPSRTRRRR
jgi:Fur family ferric uptake transcriptional regulator